MADKDYRHLRPVNSDFSPTSPGVAFGGGGPQDPYMEARIAKLEASMEHVQEDIRDIKTELRNFRGQVHDDFKSDRATARTEFLWLVGGAIAAVAVLVGVMAHGFHWI